MDPTKDSNSSQDPNGRRKSNRSPPYALFNLLVIVTAVIYAAYHQMYLSNEESKEVEDRTGDELQRIPLFTAEQLKKFDGVSEYHSYYTTSNCIIEADQLVCTALIFNCLTFAKKNTLFICLLFNFR
jgi:hypothetical protein